MKFRPANCKKAAAFRVMCYEQTSLFVSASPTGSRVGVCSQAHKVSLALLEMEICLDETPLKVKIAKKTLLFSRSLPIFLAFYLIF